MIECGAVDGSAPWIDDDRLRAGPPQGSVQQLAERAVIRELGIRRLGQPVGDLLDLLTHAHAAMRAGHVGSDQRFDFIRPLGHRQPLAARPADDHVPPLHDPRRDQSLHRFAGLLRRLVGQQGRQLRPQRGRPAAKGRLPAERQHHLHRGAVAQSDDQASTGRQVQRRDDLAAEPVGAFPVGHRGEQFAEMAAHRGFEMHFGCGRHPPHFGLVAPGDDHPQQIRLGEKENDAGMRLGRRDQHVRKTVRLAQRVRQGSVWTRSRETPGGLMNLSQESLIPIGDQARQQVAQNLGVPRLTLEVDRFDVHGGSAPLRTVRTIAEVMPHPSGAETPLARNVHKD